MQVQLKPDKGFWKCIKTLFNEALNTSQSLCLGKKYFVSNNTASSVSKSNKWEICVQK